MGSCYILTLSQICLKTAAEERSWNRFRVFSLLRNVIVHTSRSCLNRFTGHENI